MKVVAEFVQGAAAAAQAPESALAEIALIGRSNAGKSTFLNHLCARKELARTSATPGRTQELNFFSVRLLHSESHAERHLMLVDLPGFGFAKFAKKKREELSREIVEYLRSRQQLKTVCLLMDIRRSAGDDELAIRDITEQQGLNFILVLTKADKINRAEKDRHVRLHLKSFLISTDDILLGRLEAREVLWGTLLRRLDERNGAPV